MREDMEDPLSISPTSDIILSFVTATRYQHLLHEGNFTDGTNSNDEDLESTLFMMILKGIFMGMLIVMALFGNALVVSSVMRIRRLRTVTNYFVVSLAVADFLVAALVMPFNAIQEILKRWIFPEWVCYFFNSNDVLFCTASVLNLCMVAIDRYVAIVKPLRYHQVMTKRAAALMIASAWAASLGISYVPIHLNWHLPNFEAVPNADHCDFKPSAVYSLVSSAVSFWLPTVVILFVYGRIYYIAVNQAKEMRQLEQHMATVYPRQHTSSNGGSKHASISSNAGHSALKSNTADSLRKHSSERGNNRLTTLVEMSPKTARSPSNANDYSLQPSSGSVGSTYAAVAVNNQNHKTNSRSSESRATKILAIVIGCYLLCWMPFFVWLNVMAICKHCPDSGILGTILFWIGYSNSTFNPVIYAFFSREFRNAFIASLRIDKWTRLCFKLAKNQSEPSSNEKMSLPVSRSTTPKFYSVHSKERKVASSSPLQQQMRRRPHSCIQQQDKSCKDEILSDEVKQPLVAAPALVGDDVIVTAKSKSNDNNSNSSSKDIGENNVRSHNHLAEQITLNIEDDESDALLSQPEDHTNNSQKFSNKHVSKTQSSSITPDDFSLTMDCNGRQSPHLNGVVSVNNFNFVNGSTNGNKKNVKLTYEVSTALLEEPSQKVLAEDVSIA